MRAASDENKPAWLSFGEHQRDRGLKGLSDADEMDRAHASPRDRVAFREGVEIDHCGVADHRVEPPFGGGRPPHEGRFRPRRSEIVLKGGENALAKSR